MVSSSDKNISVINPSCLGWMEKKLNQQELDYVWKCIDNKKGNCKKTLVGNITGSYDLIDYGDWFWVNTLKPLCLRYAVEFGENMGELVPIPTQHPYYLKRWWVNYQNQYEFNPLHNHNGVYSFVIWMKIPTDYNEQRKNPIAHDSDSYDISNFQFRFPNIRGKLVHHNYEMKKENEGKLLFFPSELMHQVYPFYNCDEERISVSGNIMLNTAKRL